MLFLTKCILRKSRKNPTPISKKCMNCLIDCEANLSKIRRDSRKIPSFARPNRRKKSQEGRRISRLRPLEQNGFWKTLYMGATLCQLDKWNSRVPVVYLALANSG